MFKNNIIKPKNVVKVVSLNYPNVRSLLLILIVKVKTFLAPNKTYRNVYFNRLRVRVFIFFLIMKLIIIIYRLPPKKCLG